MNDKERFDQLERLLAELLRRADRQDEFNARVDQRFDHLDQRFGRVDQRFDQVSDQIDDIIGILKIAAEATRLSGLQQDQILRDIREQGRRTDATQAEILRLMQRWDEQEAHNQTVAQRLAATDSHGPRIQRLEDEAFRQTS